MNRKQPIIKKINFQLKIKNLKSVVEVTEICPTKTMARIKAGAYLIDVRENVEVEQLQFDVPNLIHIPLSKFEENYHQIPLHLDLVVVCKTGSRSLRVASFLLNKGYPNVVNMKNGIVRWVQKGFPTKGDASFIPQKSNCCSHHESSNNSNNCCH